MLIQLKGLGFHESEVQLALESTGNNMESALEFLAQTQNNETDLRALIERLQNSDFFSGPSTSSGANTLSNNFIQKLEKEIESLQAYRRFQEDTTINEYDYLDLPLFHEEQILQEYKNLFEQ